MIFQTETSFFSLLFSAQSIQHLLLILTLILSPPASHHPQFPTSDCFPASTILASPFWHKACVDGSANGEAWPHLVSSGTLVLRSCPYWQILVRSPSHLYCVSRAQFCTTCPSQNHDAGLVEGRRLSEALVELSTSPLLSNILVSSPTSLRNPEMGLSVKRRKPRNPVPSLCYRSPSSQDPEASDSAKNPPCKILPHLEKLRSPRLSPTSSKRKVPSEGVLNFRHGTSEGFRGTPRDRQHREHSSFAQHTALAVSATPRSS